MKTRLLGFPKMFGLLSKSFDTGRATWLLTGREDSATEAVAVGTERAAAVVDVDEREEKVRRNGDKKEVRAAEKAYPSSALLLLYHHMDHILFNSILI